MSRYVTIREMSQVFAVLSLFTLAATIIVIVVAAVHRARPHSIAGGSLFNEIRTVAARLAFVVALGATLGSLYLSEVAHFTPCPLCWLQRACMYPLTVVLLLGIARPQRKTWRYVLPSAIVGAGVAAYHTQLQAFPSQVHFCKIGGDTCAIRWLWEFGFVSIPFMALMAFAFIISMMLLERTRPRELPVR